jgi:hypothetical protein
MDDLTTPAPAGQVYVCAACGKQSSTKSGFDETYRKRTAISHGWDESCMLHAVLCFEQTRRPPDPMLWTAVP